MSNVLFPLAGTLILFKIGDTHRTDLPLIPPEYRAWAELPPPETDAADPGRTLRLLIALVVVVVLGVGFFVVLPRLAE